MNVAVNEHQQTTTTRMREPLTFFLFLKGWGRLFKSLFVSFDDHQQKPEMVKLYLWRGVFIFVVVVVVSNVRLFVWRPSSTTLFCNILICAFVWRSVIKGDSTILFVFPDLHCFYFQVSLCLFPWRPSPSTTTIGPGNIILFLKTKMSLSPFF